MSGQSEKKSKKTLWRKVLIFTLAAILCGVLTGALFQMYRYNDSSSEKEINITAQNTEEGNTSEGATEAASVNENKSDYSSEHVSTLKVTSADVSAVVDCIMPAVVSIDCTVTTTIDSFWGIPETYQGTSSGSGFIIGQNGSEILIATNNHVISDAQDVKVTFNEGTTAEAQVKGQDVYYDLAVITVNIDNLEQSTVDSLKIASIGDSDNVQTGSMSIAIGNALGYGQATTVGYISALDREVTIDGKIMKLFQTDAAINPGNSGGPLLNANGEVIGINSIKYASTKIEGMGYAIPINKAIPIINELMNREELSASETGYLGVQGKDINSTYAKGFNMPEGIYVFAVDEDSPAAEAGIMVGDVIVGINGREVKTNEEMKNILKYIRAGVNIDLEIRSLENGSYIEKTIKICLAHK